MRAGGRVPRLRPSRASRLSVTALTANSAPDSDRHRSTSSRTVSSRWAEMSISAIVLPQSPGVTQRSVVKESENAALPAPMMVIFAL